MANRSINLLRSVSRVTHESLGDAEMLRRFVVHQDSAAFEVLVLRHGPAIFSACRRMLHDRHLAEDALQATFLLLSRKAATIRDGDQLPGWLHRTACRVCWRAGKSVHAEPLTSDPIAPPTSSLEPDVAAILDTEVNRLPERLRHVVVLCYLENRNTDEVARMLGIPRGTVMSRLATARSKLAASLTKQGLAPALGVAILTGTLSADLVHRCVTIGCHSSVALATVPFQLAQGVLVMSLRKFVLAWSMVLVGIAGVGSGVAVVATAGDEPGTSHKPYPPNFPELQKSKVTEFDKQVTESRKAFDSLHGTWELIKIEVNDRDISHEKGSENAIGQKRTFKGTFVTTVTTPGKATRESKPTRYVTSTIGGVSHLNYCGDSVPGLKLLIYQLDKDILKIGYSKKPALYRPKSFSVKDLIDGDTLAVLTYKRVKDEPTVEKEQTKPKIEQPSAEAKTQEYLSKLNHLREKQLSPVLIDSKKAALVAVEQELVKAEVKLIQLRPKYEMLSKLAKQGGVSKSDLVPYEAQQKVMIYLEERQKQLQHELIESLEINEEIEEANKQSQHYYSMSTDWLRQAEELRAKQR